MYNKELIIKSIEINIKQLQDNLKVTTDPVTTLKYQKAITRKQASILFLKKLQQT